jgi:23S rRNA (uracil1939-C5)-methyltransferase
MRAVQVGDRFTLVIEKPAAGGRMIARHDGAVVLVSGCIPGETVDVEIEKIQRGTAWAATRRVVEASADRVVAADDGSCGGSVLAHVRYERQLGIKQDIIRDAFARLGKLQIPDLVVHGSPVDGYRMRARLHVSRGRIGFFREGTHELCDPAPTRQLLAASLDVLRRLEGALRQNPGASPSIVELAENCSADERALHLELPPGGEPSRLGQLPAIDGVTGLSCAVGAQHRPVVLRGTPVVTDRLVVPAAGGPFTVTLARHAHAFFQANRFLLPQLTATVVDAVPAGDVLDLYAGVGLFSAALAVRGTGHVVAVEGDPAAAGDLRTNAHVFGAALIARHESVERHLAGRRSSPPRTVLVDPPRTGMSREALAGIVALGAPRVVYVSCDVATLARDARRLVDAGYPLLETLAFDLFPNTAHVETVAVFGQ